MSKEQLEFFTKLQQLLKKYDAKIEGCGCCDSPWVCIGSESWDQICADGYKITCANKETSQTELILGHQLDQV